jgi:signal transduction histidine kinase
MTAFTSAPLQQPAGTYPVVVPVESLPQPRLRELLRVIPERTPWLVVAWGMLAIGLLCAIAMLTMLAYAVARDGFSTDFLAMFVWGPLFLCTTIVGVLILQKYPGHRVGWTVLLAGFVWLVAHTPYFYGTLALTRPEWDLPAGPNVIQAGFFYPFGLYLLLVELPLVFPSGRLTSAWWNVARIVGFYGAAVASWLWGFGFPLVEFGMFGEIANPWFVETRVTDWLARINPYDLIFAMGIPALVSMIVRLRRSTGVERMQLRWIAWVAAIVISGYLVHMSARVGALERVLPESLQWVYVVYWGLCLNAIGIVVGVAILRYRLYDIDLVLHRSLLYSTLVGMVAVAYIGLASLANLIVGGAEPENPRLWTTAVLVAAIVALLAYPIRTRTHHLLNRWLFGSRDDPDEILSRLGLHLELALAPADLLREVTRSVRDLLRLPHVAVAMSNGAELEIVAESGTPGPEQAAIPLVYQHDRIGELRVTPRSPGEGFSSADRAVLESIARQTAMAAYAARVTGDLQRARERLVTTREEERRRLRRDLHDGLGAHLAALTIQAGSIRRTVRSDPDRAERDLDAIQSELRTAIGDVRRLVHGLRPPALDEFGLVPALRTRLLGFEGATGIEQVRLELIGEDRPLPDAMEVAIYRIVEESLINASRHGRARLVTITLDHRGPILLTIVDDGLGLPDQMEPGIGIHSMRERAEELGGSFLIAPAGEAGVRIEAIFPASLEWSE